MGLIGAWILQVPLALLLLAVVCGPGFAILRILRVRTLLALALSPAISAAIVGPTTVLLARLYIPWGWLPYLVSAAAGIAVAFAVRRFIIPADARALTSASAAHIDPRQRWIIVAAGGFMLLCTLAPIVLWIDPTLPNPRVDPMYHYNGLNAMVHSGDASMFSAMTYNYGLRTLYVTYPSVWHAFVFLAVPISGVVTPANVMGYAVTAVLFAIAMAALACELFRDRPRLIWLTVLAASGFVAFPGYISVTKTFWPNGLAMAMLPGILALLIAVRSGFRWGRTRFRPGYAACVVGIALVAVLGISMTHPSMFFTLIWVLVPLAVSTVRSVLRVLRTRLSRRRMARVYAMAAALLIVLTVAALLPQRVRGYLSRESAADWTDVGTKLVSIIVNWPAGTSPPMLAVYVFGIIPVILLGLVLALRKRRTSWIAGAWLMQIVLLIGAYFPIPGLAGLTGLWYSDPYRMFATQTIFASVLVALAAQAMFEGIPEQAERARLLRRPPMRVGLMAWAAAFLVLHATLGVLLLNGYSRGIGTASASSRPVGSQEEYAMLKRLDDKIPAGSVIVGDPAAGTAYTPLFSEVQSVFTQVNPRELDYDGNYLYTHFRDIHTDPAVCAIIRHYGIGYYYEDETAFYNGTDRHEFAPGFYGVDTSRGFTKVDSGDTATVWRIDACGTIDPPEDWWNRGWRKTPIMGTLIEDPTMRPAGGRQSTAPAE